MIDSCFTFSISSLLAHLPLPINVFIILTYKMISNSLPKGYFFSAHHENFWEFFMFAVSTFLSLALSIIVFRSSKLYWKCLSLCPVDGHIYSCNYQTFPSALIPLHLWQHLILYNITFILKAPFSFVHQSKETISLPISSKYRHFLSMYLLSKIFYLHSSYPQRHVCSF